MSVRGLMSPPPAKNDKWLHVALKPRLVLIALAIVTDTISKGTNPKKTQDLLLLHQILSNAHRATLTDFITGEP